VTRMLTVKASAAAAVVLGTAAISAGAGYAVSKATTVATIAVSCPAVASAAALPHSLPNGGRPLPLNGKKW
jgi:hypothetical protein